MEKAQDLAQKKVDDLRTELLEAIDNVGVPRFYEFNTRYGSTFIKDKNSFPMITPNSYFMCASQASHDYANDWPGNAVYLMIKINNELLNNDLATGQGNFVIRNATGDVMLAGMVNSYMGKVTLGTHQYEKFHIEKWSASGTRWVEHDVYNLAFGGTHWEPRS